MILDSSVIVAIALREPGSEQLVEKLRSADAIGIGAPTLTEAGMVLSSRLGRATGSAGFRRFGKGRHPAALNFGDCLSYAAARLADHPPLFRR